jgi:hypothetical protein
MYKDPDEAVRNGMSRLFESMTAPAPTYVPVSRGSLLAVVGVSVGIETFNETSGRG